jgi:hypothetical protein
VVLWRLHYALSLRDLSEIFLIRSMVFSHEAVREWEAKLAPALAEGLRRRQHELVQDPTPLQPIRPRVPFRYRYYQLVPRCHAHPPH